MRDNLESFWNFKIKGVIGAFLLIFSRLIEIVNTKIISFFIKRNFASFGSNVMIEKGFKYRNPLKIKIGSNVNIGKNVVFTSEIKSGYIIIEDNVNIGRNCKIDFSGGVIIKENTLLSEGVIIQSHDHGLNPKSKPIGCELIIHKNVWIGLEAMILYSAKHIGENAILGARALLTKPINEKEIFAGIPAKKIKTRIDL
ncbi:acyltransferase [Tenacibaculum finnmarkense]|uniref:acyltransferase n=1 Tax=Tenacibaculum finnmarkense TaxID=2781243 RepID=UPI001E2F2FFA|nr:acyltransferase [Tenacibaculum finnmarkense]MCD8411718.1 acyltransferase [Tenacibaculum finnmarkense genomovar ulcerans]MCD8454719.1 acyltransferase [Tenacibaculum finnmarkense genomovar ulcerans]MCG8206776.1 hypothetical protein [Tenacibaculum finnmarkense genomovar finnmarkense]MCG8209883.1 hypothetical protein [Tenacibaculum finnmarkense genomovar finnmarkense]MCG8225458.1 hypothetical protein [Tenacibaculum finnmarkense genomovar finnmarkense]